MNENYNNQNFSNNVQPQPTNNQPLGGNSVNTSNKGTSFLDNVPKDKFSLIGYAGALITLIANFLPFVVMEASFLGVTASDSFSYFSTNAGKIVLVLAIASAVLIALKKQVYSVITIAIALIQFIYNLINVSDAAAENSYSGIVDVKWGLGIYLTMIGIAALGVSLFFYWKQNPNCFKEAIDKVKNRKGQKPMMNQQPVQPNMGVQQDMGMQQPVQMQPMDQQSMMNQQPMNNQGMVQPMMSQQPAQPNMGVQQDMGMQQPVQMQPMDQQPMNNNQNNNF